MATYPVHTGWASETPPYLRPPEARPATSSGATALTVMALNALAVGLVAVGGGAYWGVRATSLRNDVQSGQNDQTTASAKVDESQKLAGRANLLLVVGGLLSLAGGAGTFALVRRDSGSPAPVAASPAPADPVRVQVEEPRPPPAEIEAATYSLVGVVVDSTTGAPIADALTWVSGIEEPLRIDPLSRQFRTGELHVTGNEVRVETHAQGYETTTLTLNVRQGGARTVSIELTPTETKGWLRGTVSDARTGKPLKATILVAGLNEKVKTENDGNFEISTKAGLWEVLVSSRGYATQQKWVRVEANGTVIFNIDLHRRRRRQ